MSKKIFSKPSFIYAIKYPNPNLEGDSDSTIIHYLKKQIKNNQLVYDKRKSLYKIGKSTNPFNRFRLIKKNAFAWIYSACYKSCNSFPDIIF